MNTAALNVTQSRPHASRAMANYRAMRIIVIRELIRFVNDRMRLLTSLIQPVLYLFVLGTGLSSLTGLGSGGSVSLRTFMFPGVLVLTVVFTAMFAAGSIVWDREFGFMREMLVAPVSRQALVLGKCIGGATVSTLQGAILIVLSGLNGVPYDPVLILEMLGVMLLVAFTMTSIGIAFASRMRNIQSFFGLMQMLVMPMFFLSGALYPLSGLPDWLSILTRFNPLTYAVDPLRRAVLGYVDLGPFAGRFSSHITWFGWAVPIWLELLVVFASGVLALGFAITTFSRKDG